MDCTVRTGCEATMKAGVVKPYGQVCRKETRKSGGEKQDLLAAKPGRGLVSLDCRGRDAKNKGRKKWSRGVDSLATKLERGPRTGSYWR